MHTKTGFRGGDSFTLRSSSSSSSEVLDLEVEEDVERDLRVRVGWMRVSMGSRGSGTEE